MAKIKVRIDYDWLFGHLRYGHREGILVLSDEEYEEFKEDPKLFFHETGMDCDLHLTIDDYDLNDEGDCQIVYEEIIDE